MYVSSKPFTRFCRNYCGAEIYNSLICFSSFVPRVNKAFGSTESSIILLCHIFAFLSFLGSIFKYFWVRHTKWNDNGIIMNMIAPLSQRKTSITRIYQYLRPKRSIFRCLQMSFELNWIVVRTVYISAIISLLGYFPECK